jgi:hypothetical protein
MTAQEFLAIWLVPTITTSIIGTTVMAARFAQIVRTSRACMSSPLARALNWSAVTVSC